MATTQIAGAGFRLDDMRRELNLNAYSILCLHHSGRLRGRRVSLPSGKSHLIWQANEVRAFKVKHGDCSQFAKVHRRNRTAATDSSSGTQTTT